MVALNRKPFQGVTNIVQFNWHMYALATISIGITLMALHWMPVGVVPVVRLIGLVAVSAILISLAVSHYVYDRSNLYTLDWLDSLNIRSSDHVANVNAGFDETSALLAAKYNLTSLRVLDFYDPENHTEVSIKRARKAYAVYPGTKTISTSAIPLEPESMNYIFAILSVHEIRDHEERKRFFQAIQTSLKPEGRIVVVEHLRDIPNFIAYTIGVFHFFSKSSWKATFTAADLSVVEEIKITPFISAFILRKNGNAYQDHGDVPQKHSI